MRKQLEELMSTSERLLESMDRCTVFCSIIEKCLNFTITQLSLIYKKKYIYIGKSTILFFLNARLYARHYLARVATHGRKKI